jgi:tetratricopeptide (TPR) repeat protein
MAALIVVAIVAVVLLRQRPHSRRPPAPPHPAERLSAEEAHRLGLVLARQSRPLEAAGYFRRVVAISPHSWFAHQNYAAALGNGVLEARLHLGREEIATRSSVDRIAMLRESLRETEIAERLAAAPSERATALTERARVLYTWGFPIQALAIYRTAATLVPGHRIVTEAISQVETELKAGGRP